MANNTTPTPPPSSHPTVTHIHVRKDYTTLWTSIAIIAVGLLAYATYAAYYSSRSQSPALSETTSSSVSATPATSTPAPAARTTDSGENAAAATNTTP